MHWDIDDLNKKIVMLYNMLCCAEDKNTINKLKYDIYILKNLISYKMKNKKINNSFCDDFYSPCIRNNKIKVVKHLIESRDLEKKIRSLYCILHFKPHLNIIFSRIKINEFLDIVNDFFNFYDDAHFRLFNNMASNNQIEINKSKFVKYAGGVNIHLASFGISYVQAIYKSIGDMRILPHEIAHAYQFDGIQSLEENFNKVNSIFSEAYAKFINYVFAYYMKNSCCDKYRKIGILLESTLLEDFSLLIESRLGVFELIKSNDENLYFDEYEFLIQFYSNLLAVYLFNEYRADRDNCMDLVEEFNEYYGKVDDALILQKYSGNIENNGIFKLLKYYYNE